MSINGKKYPDYYIREQWPVQMDDGTETMGMICLMKDIRNLQPGKEYYEGIADAYRSLGMEGKIRTALEPALERSRKRAGK